MIQKYLNTLKKMFLSGLHDHFLMFFTYISLYQKITFSFQSRIIVER